MKRKNVFIITLCIPFVFLFFSCGIKEEDIVLKTPEQICSDMNNRFGENFTIINKHTNDGRDYKGTSVTLTTPTFSEEKIIAMYGYNHSVLGGWIESNKSNYNYFHFKDKIESEYTEKIAEYFTGINYKAVNASNSESVYDEFGKTDNLEEYLKATGSSIEYYICFESENNELQAIINSIKNKTLQGEEPVHFYFFVKGNFNSLSDETILNFNQNDAFDTSFTF